MINDETLELLSAYLDGALPEGERRALEARLAASAELRRELEELRATALAIRSLPQEPLPSGFLTRFQARRARGDAPRPDWVLLPPVMRPVALALSCGLVALAIWDKVVIAPGPELLKSDNEAKIETAAQAPTAQFDVSKRAAGGSADSLSATPEGRGLSVAGPVTDPVQPGEVLPRLQEREDKAAESELRSRADARRLPSSVAAARGSAAPARAAGKPLELTDRSRPAMTEEERSARNEQMFGYIEAEKKKMGIASVAPKGAGASGMLGAKAEPAAPAIAAPVPSLLKKISREGPAAADAVMPSKPGGPGRLSPDGGLVFGDAASLRSSWILLGFPGLPPVTDFAAGRLVLIKPSSTKILSVTTNPGAVIVVYRSLLPDETPDAAQDRVAPIPSEPKTVLIYDATPR